MSPERPILRYFGGKWMLAPWIIEHFPPHRIYIEPFGGAASVLMRKPRSKIEVYNDLAGDVVNLFRILRNKIAGEDLRRMLELTPFAREEYDLAHTNGEDPLEDAMRLIIRSFMGHGADSMTSSSKSGFRANSNSSNRTAALDWMNYAPAVPAFIERLQGVVIEHRPAIAVMAAHDASNALLYVDPPYSHDTRGTRHSYCHEMTEEEHVELCDFLKTLEGMVILSGYETPIYERLGWETVKREALADGARPRVEVLWLNPAAVAAQSQLKLFEVTT